MNQHEASHNGWVARVRPEVAAALETAIHQIISFGFLFLTVEIITGAWVSIIGFASVAFTCFGVNFLLSSLDSYGSS